jgi:hypothetical protein
LAAIRFVARSIGAEAWFLIIALSPIWIPIGFAGFLLGRKQASLTLLVLFAATEAIASALFYFLVSIYG